MLYNIAVRQDGYGGQASQHTLRLGAYGHHTHCTRYSLWYDAPRFTVRYQQPLLLWGRAIHMSYVLLHACALISDHPCAQPCLQYPTGRPAWQVAQQQLPTRESFGSCWCSSLTTLSTAALAALSSSSVGHTRPGRALNTFLYAALGLSTGPRNTCGQGVICRRVPHGMAKANY